MNLKERFAQNPRALNTPVLTKLPLFRITSPISAILSIVVHIIGILLEEGMHSKAVGWLG